MMTAKESTEHRSKGQIGQPAACMIENNGASFYEVGCFPRAHPRWGPIVSIIPWSSKALHCSQKWWTTLWISLWGGS